MDYIVEFLHSDLFHIIPIFNFHRMVESYDGVYSMAVLNISFRFLR